MNDHITYFGTKPEAENFYIDSNTTPWVGFIEDEEIPLFCEEGEYGAVVNGEVTRLDKLEYIADRDLASITSVTAFDAPVFTHKYNSETKEGLFIFLTSPTQLCQDAFFSAPILEITIPKSISDIHCSAFDSCDLLTRLSVDNENPYYDSRENCNAIIDSRTDTLVIGCTTSTIPDSVVKIGDCAFTNSNVTDIILPNSIKSIGYNAFKACTNLATVFMPKHITDIGDNAFLNCTSLKSISLPNITTIPFGLCSGCSNLSEVTIPESVTTIGEEAFYRCTSLNEIALPSLVQIIPRRCFAFCENLKRVEFPKQLRQLYPYSFAACKSLTDVNIPEGTGSIFEYAFNQCSGIETLTIPSTVTSISRDAFSGCTNVRTLNYNVSGKLFFISAYDAEEVFRSMRDSVENVIIGNKVTEIFRGMCYGMTKLKDITIPSSVTTFKTFAFANSGLTRVSYQGTARSWALNSFNTQSSNPISVAKTLYIDGEPVTKLSMLDSDSYISAYSFYNCQSLTEVELNKVSSIGDYAFGNCTNLTSLVIPEFITYISSTAFYGTNINTVNWNSVECNSANVFSGLESLTELVFGESVAQISSTTFNNIPNLEHINIPSSTIYIEGGVFAGCRNLSSITVDSNNTVYDSRNQCNAIIKTGTQTLIQGCKTTLIPDTVIHIGDKAFLNTELSGDIIIPESVETLGIASFQNCPITSLTIPSTVTKIKNGALSGCSSLKTIILYGMPPVLEPNSLSNVETIIVKAEYLEAYKQDANWAQYSDKMSLSYTPESCQSLTITADDVSGRQTTTTIYYTAVTSGQSYFGPVENITITGTIESEQFAPNLSELETVQVPISFTYLDVTAETVITQGVYIPAYYTVDLNNQWQLNEAVSNPDASIYDGVYESNSNYNVNSAYATMYIDLLGYEEFTVYIRSNAESTYDYVMISQPNVSITGSTSYSDTSSVKANTRGSQNSGTAINNYKTVVYTGLDKNTSYRLTVVYRKDNSQHSGTDRGYVLIPKNQ